MSSSSTANMANPVDQVIYPRSETPIEHRRLLSIAREYRQKGYRVVVHPAPDELPPALAKCPVDLIAEGEGRKIAVEIRNRENLTLNGSEDLRRMTTLVEQEPGWEFELVVTNPRPKNSAPKV
jgi:REase_AHJR-like